MSSHAHTAPRAQLLSNGRYTVMLSDAGSGFSHWGDLAVTRWREDPTRDPWGSYVLLRDVESGAVWSAGLQPCGGATDAYAMTASAGCARIVRRDGALETTLEIAVAGDRDVELRRVTIANHGEGARTIELTSYAELVLGSAAGDASHPAFSKIFVQTEWVEEGGVLLATRRRRGHNESEIWAAHTAVIEGPDTRSTEYETDRAAFLGRGGTLRNAAGMEDGRALSNTVGSVLDPIFSLRRRVRIAPGASVEVAFWTCLAATRDAVLELARGLDQRGACERTLTTAAVHAAEDRARLGIDDEAAERCRRLVAPLLYADAAWRAPADQLERGSGGAPVLWASGISGDRPIVLLRIARDADLDHIHELLQAQSYWQSQRLGVDVVLLNDGAADDVDALHATLTTLTQTQTTRLEAEIDGAAAGVFALRHDQITDALRDGLATAARVVLDAAEGGMQIRRVDPSEERGRAVDVMRSAKVAAVSGPSPHAPGHGMVPAPETTPEEVEFGNGYGGFVKAGLEYMVTLGGTACTPAPWSNVVANPSFGFLATAEGGGHTFSCNSQQNPLTPWPNDPVSDAPHEVLYLSDLDSGALWSATALPMGEPTATFTTRHGKGYSRYTHVAHGIEVELLQCVPTADSVKLSRLRIHNRSGRTRRLSVTAYVEWALGRNGTVPAPYVVTSKDAVTGALFARNAWRAEFGARIAFADLRGLQTSWTCDRTEFLGRLGAVDRPAALAHERPLSGRAGAALDPCAALQTEIELVPDAHTEVLFLLGDAASQADAQALVTRYRNADVDTVLREVEALWDNLHDAVQVRTPDRAMDILLNDWLLYQTLSCRVWARAAYYQSSGAYGFRDQLQDGLSLCVARPDVVREHLLRSAARQFVEGDVQHWWLPPAGQGVRTRITDDRIWLPYVAMHYVDVTGEAAVLDEIVPFLEGAALEDGEHEAFFQPTVSAQRASLYEHCARALDVSLSLGPHGLPLMGTGDWNDGMNRVGIGGRGESVWLAWFLLDTLARFAPIAEARGDHDRPRAWRQCAATVRTALEHDGWDGAWYRRGYYDDGTPLGSDRSDECKIDVIAQSWSVMSGVADPARAVQAMAAVDARLVDRKNRVAMLFTPPFDRARQDPGYIKGYPPGIRENGGQYTHGSVWSIFAWAKLGDGDRAGELFNIFNPIRHADSTEASAQYKVEPYVSCADMYSVASLAGRGGWTWYTGSAGWLYRAGLEAILGFNVRGDRVRIDPCIPKAWPGFSITYRYRSSRYIIEVDNPEGVSRGIAKVELDGVAVTGTPPPPSGAEVPLNDDGGEHRVKIVLG
ncbi:MAG: glycosyl transferase family 36 [Acidobacteria bacterium]|nr:glycosyl transferase family 36 [Acidobacteriota bacterium]